jgi:hypothetical protein
MAQRYTDLRALDRMDRGLCPECGGTVTQHTGWGRGDCSLTDNGVAERVAQFHRDREAGVR